MSASYLLGVTDARTHFKREGVTVAAFAAPDGRHVLLELDTNRDQVGLIDPTNLRSWVLAKRIHDCWPLTPLGTHRSGDPS